VNVKHLLAEFDLTIDDVRWYLAHNEAESLLSYAESPEELTRLIWSGELESRLYNMAERYLKHMEDEVNRGLTDETRFREQLSEAAALAAKRRRG